MLERLFLIFWNLFGKYSTVVPIVVCGLNYTSDLPLADHDEDDGGVDSKDLPSRSELAVDG